MIKAAVETFATEAARLLAERLIGEKEDDELEESDESKSKGK